MIAPGQPAGAGQVAAGVAVAMASAVLYDTGYLLEKHALSALPRLAARPLSMVRTVAKSPVWVAGFAAMGAGLALQVVALTLAPVTVVQPVLAAGVLALVVLGRLVLGEQLGKRELAALALIVVAVIAVALSAEPGARMAARVPEAAFTALAALGVLAGAAVWFAGRDGRVAGRREAAALAGAAGLLYGIGALAEKAVAVRLVGHGMAAGAATTLGTVYPWVFLAATFGGMVVFQVGLQRHPASLVVPLASVVSTGWALVGASVVFDELLIPAGWWALPRWLGFGAVLASVAVLVAEPDGRRAPAVA